MKEDDSYRCYRHRSAITYRCVLRKKNLGMATIYARILIPGIFTDHSRATVLIFILPKRWHRDMGEQNIGDIYRVFSARGV